MGNRIYGCDDCLAACPWNKYAHAAREAKLAARDDLLAPRLADLVRLDDAAFRKLFSANPVKRVGHARFIRNVLIAIGNTGDASFAPAVREKLDDPSPLVRAMAVWAAARLHGRRDFLALAAQYRAAETDAEVRAEWTQEIELAT
jgi:epoxyqueuosine reductase